MRQRLGWEVWAPVALLAGTFWLAGVSRAEDKAASNPTHAEMSAPTQPAEPVGASTCLGCHADHEGFKKNLHSEAFKNAKKIDFEKSCETCHGNGSLHAAAAGDKNNSGFWTIKNPAKMKATEAAGVCMQCHTGGHQAHWVGSAHEVKNLACQSCHSMHKEEVNEGKAPLLKKASVMETCYQCHADKKAQIEKSAHMPLKEGKMTCLSCHNPHGSSEEKLMAKESVMETCYQCHADKRGPMLWPHPPVTENCLSCHNPHGSHNDKMLVTKAPLLCQRCHIGTRHPSGMYSSVEIGAMSDRAIDRSCLNCHTKIHGSNHPSGKFYMR